MEHHHLYGTIIHKPYLISKQSATQLPTALVLKDYFYIFKSPINPYSWKIETTYGAYSSQSGFCLLRYNKLFVVISDPYSYPQGSLHGYHPALSGIVYSAFSWLLHVYVSFSVSKQDRYH